MKKLRIARYAFLASVYWLAACTTSASETTTSQEAEATTVDAAATSAVNDLPVEASTDFDAASAPVGLEQVEDPVTLEAGWGSGFDGGPIVDKIPDHSEAVVKGQLVRVGDTRLNTEDGTWMPQSDPTALLNQRAGLLVMTTLEVTVHDVLGRSPAARIDPKVGDTLSVTILGGVAEFTITPQEAGITGFRPDISDEEEQRGIDAGDVPNPNDPAPIPDKPFTAGLETPYFVTLTEGDEIVVFLRVSPMYDIAKNDGTNYNTTILAPTHEMGQGIFVADDGQYLEASDGEKVSEEKIRALARQVSERNEAPVSPGPAGLFQQ